MDERPSTTTCDSLVISGLGSVISRDCDALPYLKVPKSRKFMGPQDIMAVVAAGDALKSAGLLGQSLGERSGLFLVVGYIPFEQDDITRMMDASIDEKGFSMQRFSTDGLSSINPLLTFRCLPNMPAFHISVNFDLQGPYFVSYPGPGQFYCALEKACSYLEAGVIDIALVGAVAHQKNFLVEHHFSRITHPIVSERLVDAAGCLVLENASHATKRSANIRARVLEYQLSYQSHDPFKEPPAPQERFTGDSHHGDCPLVGEMGPSSLPVTLSSSKKGIIRHHLESRDGIHASSTWEIN